ncbi:DEAD/DEAH box helicase [Bacillus sp. EAC]|uniref:DEAD/DEAH box helicase n=1 Tax=Bacillus sp. EAC TaxID=1978338 RepID=UPI000B43B278|nr:DEAD/DEAH box helicase [Bacillus sp. EAC]
MDIKINHKIIKEMCGTVSFKRGDSFYRAKKVKFESYGPDCCVAKVIGLEEFKVTVNSDADGGFIAKCSCPSLVSFQRDCQHIAAVLISIVEQKRVAVTTVDTKNELMDSFIHNDLTDDVVKLFNGASIRSSSEQMYFENREIVQFEFNCKVIAKSNEEYVCGIELKFESHSLSNVREFLNQLKEGKKIKLTNSFTFDPTIHCFQKESDNVFQVLIKIMEDEKMYINSFQESIDWNVSDQLFIIPPSYWTKLLKILTKIPFVNLNANGVEYEGIKLSNNSLPLLFEFDRINRRTFQLKVAGMNEFILLKSYSQTLYEGKLYPLKQEDFSRLIEIKKLLHDSGTDQISIQSEQIDFFMSSVIPQLKKIGTVNMSDAFSNQFTKTSLVAKLYLDRVKNRLLAGLDFHYEHIVINPLDERDHLNTSKVIRDELKENEILRLMEQSSFSKTEGGYYLHNEELEYEFLHNIVPKLEKIVQIHATTAVRNRIFRENTFPKIRVKLKKERTNWLEFKFEMDGIPEKQIKEILLAIKEKRKYYRLRNGTLFSLEKRESEEIRRFLNAAPVQDIDLESEFNVPIIRGLQLLDSYDESSTFEIENSFRQFIDSINNPNDFEIDIPNHLNSILRDYQKHGYRWMKALTKYGFGGILADDMGLGKTLQSITYIQSIIPTIRQQKLPVLIVCPSSLTYNWSNEILKFAPDIQAIVIDGNATERADLQSDLSEIDVIITSYPLLRNDIKWYEKQTFHTVFFDEAQAFKNPTTQTARVVKKVQADFRFALTGTPVENSLEELWSIYHVVFPELFQGLKEYSNLTRKTIARRVKPFLLRRMKEDVLSELPEKIESMESVELLPEQKKLYAAYLAKLQHDTLKHLANDKFTLGKNRIKILAGLTRLRQICCHPALFIEGYKGSSAKFEQLLQIIEEAKLSNRRVLIFSQFTKMLEIIGKELANQGVPFFYLDGKTPSEERVELCNRFNEGERNLFLISMKAGGVGLNLTGANTVILYDIWWNPAVESQAADRAHRFGQTNIVEVIKLVSRGTIEEKMNELQLKKKELIDEIIDSNSKSTTILTEEDIREILMI